MIVAGLRLRGTMAWPVMRHLGHRKASTPSEREAKGGNNQGGSAHGGTFRWVTVLNAIRPQL